MSRENVELVRRAFEAGEEVKGSDEEVRQKMGVVYADFRDGTIGEARFYFTWEDALEAAGLD